MRKQKGAPSFPHTSIISLSRATTLRHRIKARSMHLCRHRCSFVASFLQIMSFNLSWVHLFLFLLFFKLDLLLLLFFNLDLLLFLINCSYYLRSVLCCFGFILVFLSIFYFLWFLPLFVREKEKVKQYIFLMFLCKNSSFMLEANLL